MSNPFAALDLSDDENITVVKPAAPAPVKVPAKNRKELQKEEADLQQKKKGGARNAHPQPEVAHPGERSKIGLKKEEKVRTHKHVDPAAPNARGGRVFDRHSGTGRGREVRKGGAGGRNWGKPGDEVAVEGGAATPVEGGAATPVAEEAVPEVVEEPQLTLEDFEAQRQAKRSGAAFAEKQARKVEALPNLTVFKKEDTAYIQLGKEEAEKKKAAAKESKPKKQVFEAEFKFAPERESSNEGRRGDFNGSSRREGGARPPRDGARPPRGDKASAAPRAAGGRSNQAPIDTADQSAFPKLGA